MRIKLFLLIILGCLFAINANCQDKIVLKDSTIINAKVLESNEDNVVFSYPNESVKNTKSKSTIAYILYASGRKEICNKGIDIPTINGEDDWDKVVLTNDKNDITNLKLIKSISASAGNGGVFGSASKAHDTAIKKLKKKAAKLHGSVILITTDSFGGEYHNISSMAGEVYQK